MVKITDISQLDLTKQYTYADYLTWWFDERVELIKGYIKKMSPAPSNKHQMVSGNIFRELSVYLSKKTCKVYHAPYDVRLTRSKNDQQITTVVQPDLCVICHPEYIDDRGCNGPPDMIVE
ncbi:MAG: Uma2 family endonuclease, partial [Cytophagales bacterium]|nr:Uma2 family endonuclease [Cytophagales bacterium]